MHLPEREIRILQDLIGRKVEGIYVAKTSAALPVEVYIQLADGKIIKIDSCSRSQYPTETLKAYPQLRIQKNSLLPGYPLLNLVGSSGEIVQSIQILDEQFQTQHNFVSFSCGICLHLIGNRAVSVMRESFRHPGLEVCPRDMTRDEKYQDQRYCHFQLTDL